MKMYNFANFLLEGREADMISSELGLVVLKYLAENKNTADLKIRQVVYFSIDDGDNIRGVAGRSRLPRGIDGTILSNFVQAAMQDGYKYYFDDTELVKEDKTVLYDALHRMTYAQFYEELKKIGLKT